MLRSESYDAPCMLPGLKSSADRSSPFIPIPGLGGREGGREGEGKGGSEGGREGSGEREVRRKGGKTS